MALGMFLEAGGRCEIIVVMGAQPKNALRPLPGHSHGDAAGDTEASFGLRPLVSRDTVRIDRIIITHWIK